MGIPCFLLTPTNRAARWLRRYLSSEVPEGVRLCEPLGYHDALVRIEDGPLVLLEKGKRTTDPLTWSVDDPRWPTQCDHCDYRFDDREVRQLFYQPIYLTPDGRDVVLHSQPLPGAELAPVGAMWDADWYRPHWQGPDGRCLVVRTPGGDWVIDGPAEDGGRWTRTGTPPRVTVSPSILISDRYHGWLRDGELVEA